MKRITTVFFLFFVLHSSFASVADTGKPKVERELNAFIKDYVDATNSHDFDTVEPLLLAEAVFWFNKSESQGIDAIRKNFESTWGYLPDEVYGIEKVKWLSIEKNSATCIYEYTYQGTHEGKAVKGRGRGTSVLVKKRGKWRISHEHLSIPV
ncbi:ketosteroid isomerase-like protein [Pontibacter ummariensis]|uniref:Ketosteroid isomerase homolog n=1 Tax=Pontibacter ummariensis TaxID=1610492 RepID=A0A239LXR5_9BACT|nr:nuclear transport factor 2 family protein [Pontibacter ummariensis]PRY00365.1 ketosteroid isomerase-like protein [Pontibacter ummariensis]SNT34434.1 Ketosteroid isomerase homolog [Pontibacter ummariensis]